MFLVAVNVSSIFFSFTVVGRWTAYAMVFIAVSNTALVLRYNGLTRALAFPHFVWLPLVAAIIYRLFSHEQNPIGTTEFLFGMLVVFTNSISLVFDIYDGRLWVLGKREVLGLR